MAAPTYSAGSLNNVINHVSLAANGGNVAALVDLSTVLGGRLYCKLETGVTPPAAVTTSSSFGTYASTVAAPNTTISGAVAAGATSITVASATGIAQGQKLALIPAVSNVGEVVTVQSISGTTLTLAAGTENPYAAADRVYFIEATASGGTVQPTNNSGGWSANSVCGTSLYPPEAFIWILHVVNNDTAQPVTVSVTLDKNPSFQ